MGGINFRDFVPEFLKGSASAQLSPNEACPADEESITPISPSLEHLQTLDIDVLYRIINKHLDKRDVIDRLRSHVAFKKALVMGWIDAIAQSRSMGDAPHQEVNAKLMGYEGEFLDRLQAMGVNVGVDSELSPEQLAKKPHLFLSTHQGGGLETFLLAELLRRGGVKAFRYVMKDENVKIPLVGKTIASRGPILVNRERLQNQRYEEITSIAEEIAAAMANGESVLFFFEGTRSKTGVVAHTENRQRWCVELATAVCLATRNYPGLDYGKALVVLDMLSVLPEGVEKNPLGTIRTNGDCTATIVDADNLRFQENKTDPYDPGTIFGKARTVLKQKLIERIRRYQQDYGRRCF